MTTNIKFNTNITATTPNHCHHYHPFNSYGSTTTPTVVTVNVKKREGQAGTDGDRTGQSQDRHRTGQDRTGQDTHDVASKTGLSFVHVELPKPQKPKVPKKEKGGE
jgi:hypothetical protein